MGIMIRGATNFLARNKSFPKGLFRKANPFPFVLFGKANQSVAKTSISASLGKSGKSDRPYRFREKVQENCVEHVQDNSVTIMRYKEQKRDRETTQCANKVQSEKSNCSAIC